MESHQHLEVSVAGRLVRCDTQDLIIQTSEDSEGNYHICLDSLTHHEFWLELTLRKVQHLLNHPQHEDSAYEEKGST